MVNWYRQKVCFFILICSFLDKQSVSVAVTVGQFASNSVLVNQEQKANGWLARQVISCAAINPAYQQVYSFEIKNYYINVCQLGSSFYYSRQSKFNPSNSLLVPAQAVFGGNVFQATNGKATYFVGKDGDRHYSSVMPNSNEIVFEPELQPPSSDLSQDAEANSDLPTDNLPANRANQASLELDNHGKNSPQSKPALTCLGEKSAFHPRLDSWQKLIGKSTATAN
ncbi:MAG TPA: hypothetical protein V6C71_12330 [Coleofasciculaceae cyanobacterium]|jgi:hypothetical protein